MEAQHTSHCGRRGRAWNHHRGERNCRPWQRSRCDGRGSWIGRRRECAREGETAREGERDQRQVSAGLFLGVDMIEGHNGETTGGPDAQARDPQLMLEPRSAKVNQTALGSVDVLELVWSGNVGTLLPPIIAKQRWEHILDADTS